MLSGWPGEEVVEADDVVAVGEKAVAEVRAEEAGGAGDEDSHRARLPRPIERVA